MAARGARAARGKTGNCRVAGLKYRRGAESMDRRLWAEGYTERLPKLANELVRLKVDVIVTHNTPPPARRKAGDILDSAAGRRTSGN